MRHFPAVAILMLGFGPAAGMAQNPFEPDTNIACVERLQIPVYPRMARQSKIEETVTASVLLSPRASAELVTTEVTAKAKNVSGLLIRAVEDAVRGTAFRSSCAGRTVTLVFAFKIAGRPADNPQQSVSFGYPNKFWIVTEPGTPMVESSKLK